LDLVKAISEEEGPWVIAFRQPTIDAIAQMEVNEPLLQRWASVVAKHMGQEEEDCREYLAAEVAGKFKELCSLAVQKNLGVFTCFYG
jgi:hypothetical protein